MMGENKDAAPLGSVPPSQYRGRMENGLRIERQTAGLFLDRVAVYSPCDRFRYYLAEYPANGPVKKLTWVLLNPSTATAEKDDPTMRRVRGFTERMGCNAWEVLNVFAMRETYPINVFHAGPKNAMGERNGAFVADKLANAEMAMCAWGTMGTEQAVWGEHAEAIRAAQERGVLYCLKHTKDRHPQHPLYVPYDVEPEPYTPYPTDT